MPAVLHATHAIHVFLGTPSARLLHYAIKYVVMEKGSHFLVTMGMLMMEMVAAVHAKLKLGSSAQEDLQTQKISAARLFQRL